MITLDSGQTLSGKAGTATAVTYSIFKDLITTGDSFTPIQGQLVSTTGTLYTSTGGQTLISEIQFANTTASPVTGITLYIISTGASNQLNGGFTIPANGSASYSAGVFRIYDANGLLVSTTSVTLTGDITGSGSGTIATTLATVNANVGSFGTASNVPQFSVNAKGLTTAAVNVPIVIAESAVTNLTTDLAAKQPTGNYITALTGDVTASGPGSVAAALKNTGPGATGPLGSATVAPIITIDAQGRVTALSSTLITPAAIGSPPNARLINTTAPLTGGGDLSADRTLAISAASTSAAGSQSAAQFNTVSNLWYDVTNYGVTISNSGATNTANMNTLIQTTAPAGATFFFPQTGANYPFNGAIVVTKNAQTFAGRGDFSSVLFQGSTTDDLFRVNDGIQNVTFKDLGFWVTVTMSAGAAINTGTVSGQGVVGLQVINCGFQVFGGTWFNGIVMNGTRGGEVALVSYCQMNGFTNWGIGLVGNTSTPATTSALIIDNTTMNGGITSTTGAVAGIYIQQAGAVNISNSDVISCTNNLLVAPITSVSQVVASVYAINSFFDHSHGSCVKLGGTQPITRCKFVSCSFTVTNDASANYSAFEVSNSAANPVTDLDILNCNIQNTFNNTATTNGLLLTGVANVKIIGNNINGWTNGINVTSAGAAGVTRVHIVGNTIGPGSITHTASTTGIILNAGSFAYGLVHISENTFPPTNVFQNANTANITDNSTVGTGTAQTGIKYIANNTGTVVIAPPANYTATAIPLTTVTNVDSRGGLFFPTAVRPSSGRITVYASNAATLQTLTPKLVFGPLNTSADPVLITLPAYSTGTAVLGAGLFICNWELVSATLMFATWEYHNLNNAVTGMTGTTPAAPFIQMQGSPSPGITVSTAAQNNWLGIYFSSATAAAITIRSVKYEVQSQ